MFTFGCSHTCYYWPTWADMISLEYKDYYNFGQPGTDNLSILNKLIRANDYFKITKDDTVLIMLTSWDRIDYYDDLAGWNGIGGITGDGVEEIYGRKFIENHMENYDYQIEKTYTILKSIKLILDSIGCKYRIKNAFSTEGNCNGSEILFKKSYKNTLLEIKKICDGFESLYEAGKDSETYWINNEKKGKLEPDGHCTIKRHLEFCKENFSDFYNDKWDDKILQSEKLIVNNIKQSEMAEIFKPIRYFFINHICYHHYWPTPEAIPEKSTLEKRTI